MHDAFRPERAPRVSLIIDAAGLGADFSRIDPDVMAAAIARGRGVHLAVQLVDEGDLDDRTVPGPLRPYVDAYRQFVADTGYHPVACETRLVHPTWGYCGTPDKAGFLGTDRVGLDVKTPTSLSVGPVLLQLGAYFGPGALWNATYPTEPVQGVATLQLHPKGTYKLRRREPEETMRAERTFLCALKMLRGEASRSELDELDRWTTDYDPMRRTAA